MLLICILQIVYIILISLILDGSVEVTILYFRPRLMFLVAGTRMVLCVHLDQAIIDWCLVSPIG